MIKFVESKLQRPRLTPNLLKRERLLERLRSNLSLSASFICAGPGWGKTTLATSLVESTPTPSVWYDVDSTDADIAVFFGYLVAAIRRIVPDFGRDTADILGAASSLPHEQLVDLFLYELTEAVKHELIVVIDNIHHTFTADWSAPTLYRILQLLPDNIHFVLLARVTPDFSFSRIRSKQAMDQIDDRQMALSRDEVAELFGDLIDDPQAIDRLMGWTQGWVAGLQIIRKAFESDANLRGQNIERAINASEIEIFEYFADKVYRAEPAQMRRFLAHSALPIHLTRDVLNEALGLNVSGEELHAAVRENVFLTRLAGETETYIYHPLFRDFLKKQLKEDTTDERYRSLQCKLGAYYADRESWSLALQHYFEGDDEGGAAETLLRAQSELLAAGLTGTISSFVPRFSERTLTDRPRLYTLMGEVRTMQGDSSGARTSFLSALSSKASEQDVEVRIAALAGLAHTAVREHDFDEAMTRLRLAEQFAEGLGWNLGGGSLAARIRNVAGAVRVFEGRYAEANQLMEEALRLAHQAGDSRMIRSVSQNLALPAFMEGDFQAALRYFSRSPISEASGTRRSLHPDSILLYLNRAAVYTALGHIEKAEQDLIRADEHARVFGLRGFQPRILEARGNIACEHRNFNEAARLYEAATDGYLAVDCDPVKTDLLYERSLMELRRGDSAKALDLIDQMVEDRLNAGREIELALARQMRSRVLLERDDPRCVGEADASEPLLRRLSCNYYLAISCYVRARALFSRDFERGRVAFDELLQLAERFEYSYFICTEESFHPAVRDLCNRYAINSSWLNRVLASDRGARMIDRVVHIAD